MVVCYKRGVDEISPTYAAIGKALRAAREKKGLYQKHIAGSLGVTDSNVGQIEAGQTRATISRLEDYAQLVDAELHVVLVVPGDAKSELVGSLIELLPTMSRKDVRSLQALMDTWKFDESDQQATG
ncbi:MAG: helix-turn-helix transcriptional regulator [Myxococcota bacterium]